MKTIFVKVKPNSRKNEIKEVHGLLVVYLTKSPEQGKANKQLLTMLANYYGVKLSQVLLLSGETSADKKIGIL
ncbi:MAG: DUF167 domain-containing protein [Candidatus Pacebacteria bacterium]|nr:DUF167 domain-containing protein [Candidatus Paceibacterota bacterium]